MLKLVKITSFFICAIFSLEAQSANLKLAETEFKRALSIIEKTQLELFTDTLPPDPTEILRRLESKYGLAIKQLDPDNPDYKKIQREKRVEIMRDLISETIETYNDQYANYITPDLSLIHI